MKTTHQKSEVRSQKPATCLAILIAVLCPLSSAFADLTATVTPGYVLATGEKPTTAILNRMATPSINMPPAKSLVSLRIASLPGHAACSNVACCACLERPHNNQTKWAPKTT